MEYLFAEPVYELNIINPLVNKMAGIIVISKSRMVVQGLEGSLGRGNIEGNLGGMDFESEFNTGLLKLIQDGCPAPGKFFKTMVIHFCRYRGKSIEHVPDGASRKSVNHF